MNNLARNSPPGRLSDVLNLTGMFVAAVHSQFTRVSLQMKVQLIPRTEWLVIRVALRLRLGATG